MLSTRLDLLYTIEEFPANFEGFKPVSVCLLSSIIGVEGLHIFLQALELAWRSTKELKESNNFVEVLRFILVVGNYLNYGTRQGAAYGYRLSVLPKVCTLAWSVFCNRTSSFHCSFQSLLGKIRKSL